MEKHEVASLLHMAFVRGFNAGRATCHLDQGEIYFKIRSEAVKELGKYVDDRLEKEKTK